METRSDLVKATLPSGQIIQLEATVLGGEEDVAVSIPSIDGLTDAIEGVSVAVLEGLKRIKPRKATVEFGIEVALESGKLTALLVKGSGNASIKVTLEWGQ